MGGACPSCGASNPPGAHFCSVCGTGLDAVCPSCGDPLTPGTAACATCGALPEIRHRLRERKRATILFADITGATALGESLDVERLQELMTSFYDAMRQEVEAMGGTVDTFVGDAVLAVFGVPAAHDDDPDRALTAARRMFARLSRLNESLFAAEGVTMDLRIGVNTGDVVVAANDEPELGRIAGDAVNVAARLQEHAAPGSIIVAERTVSTAHAFRFRDLGVVTLRGRTEPVRIYELGAPVHSAERSSRMSAPLVGRDNELSLLETLYDRVAREQVPHLVTIYGAAGVGKSRLVSEFFDALERRGPAPAFLVGRCRPYGESVAYGALADIIKSQASILDDDAPDLAVAKIDTLVRRLAEPSADHERVAEALTYTAGIGPDAAVFPDMSPRQIRAEIRSAWRWLFSKLAQRGDIVVVIEDIHWADPALLDLLEELADRAEGSVLVLCPARPQLTDSRPGWGGGRRSFSSIMLDPLTPEQSSDLLDLLTMSDGLPPEITTQILHRAEGNPFFMEEIIKSLIDSGTVARTADGLRALSGITDVEIPDTVHAVVAARIDLLDADHKRALQCAAVVGRSFWTGVLSFLLGWEESVLEEILEGLERRDLITARIDSEMGDQREYRFRHVLIRDVAYEMLSRTDRSSIHRWVAEWLGGTVGDRRLELVGLRAHHLLNAYDGMAAQREVGSDVELVRSRAQAALVAASAHAKRRVALGEAKHFAREARRISANLTEESEAAEALGEAFFYGYEGDAAWQYLSEAVDLRLRSDDPDPHIIASLCARALEMPVRWPGAMLSPPSEETVASYLRIGTDHVLDPESADAVRLLTVKAFWQHAFPKQPGDPTPPLIPPEEAVVAATEAVASARRLGRADLESAALDGLSACHIPEGAYVEALAAAQQRLRLVDDLRDLWEIGDTFSMNSWATYHLGRFRQTLQYADEGFGRTVDSAPSLALHCLRFRVQARFQLGDWNAVIDDYRLARRLLGEQKDLPPHYVSPMFGVAAMVHEVRGDHGEADAILDMLRRRFETSPPADRDGLTLSRWAEFVAPLLARRGRIAEAREFIEASTWRRRGRLGLLLEAAMDVAATANDWDWTNQLLPQARELAADCSLQSLASAADAAEGRAALAAGDLTRAVELLELAVADYLDRGARWAAAATQLTLAEALVAAGDGTGADKILDHCLPTLEHLGARHEIDAARELSDRSSSSHRP